MRKKLAKHHVEDGEDYNGKMEKIIMEKKGETFT